MEGVGVLKTKELAVLVDVAVVVVEEDEMVAVAVVEEDEDDEVPSDAEVLGSSLPNRTSPMNPPITGPILTPIAVPASVTAPAAEESEPRVIFASCFPIPRPTCCKENKGLAN